MKRIAVILLALALLAAMACPALGEAANTFSTAYYTLTLPEGWTIETSDLDKEENSEELGALYDPNDPGMVLEAGLIYYKDLDDITLWNADENTMQAYIDAILSDFEEDNPEYVTTLNAGAIPFIVIRAEDDDGPYYYIDTMTNGYAVVFYAYCASSDSDATLPLTDADWAQIEQILSTFQPVA